MTTSIRPPFTLETALAKVRTAEDAWNSRDPVRVSLAYSVDSIWRNRDQFFSGRSHIQEFLAGPRSSTGGPPRNSRSALTRILDLFHKTIWRQLTMSSNQKTAVVTGGTQGIGAVAHVDGVYPFPAVMQTRTVETNGTSIHVR